MFIFVNKDQVRIPEISNTQVEDRKRDKKELEKLKEQLREKEESENIVSKLFIISNYRERRRRKKINKL